MKKCVIYARVSTSDQNPEMQLQELREYAERRKFEVVHEFIDRVTGDTNGNRRNALGFSALMTASRRARPGFDVVLVWKFDRLARSLSALLAALKIFSDHQIDFISVTQQIDTTSPAGRLFFSIVGAFAEFERELIVERVRAGIKNARAKGKGWGRPRDFAAQERVLKLRKAGYSLRHIARMTGRSFANVRQIVKRPE